MKALVLDFGGVVSLTEFETHTHTEKVLGLPAGTLTWRGPFDPETDDLWQSMQRGEISERDYWHIRAREIGAMVGEEWTTLPQYLQRIVGGEPLSAIRPEALSTIEVARAWGCRLAILSNELDLFYGPEFKTGLPFLQHFDAVIDATYTRILKPDPRAFGFVTERLNVDFSDCVFVDDQARNVDGALAVGMQAVHFDVTKPAASFQLALNALGVPRG